MTSRLPAVGQLEGRERDRLKDRNEESRKERGNLGTGDRNRDRCRRNKSGMMLCCDGEDKLESGDRKVIKGGNV